MDKRDFKDYICRPFCEFFREGEKETLACQGARIVGQLVKRGRLDPDSLPGHKKRPRLWKEYNGTLYTHLCQQCSFRSEDCDFRSRNGPPDSEPCGGYILLSLLKVEGIITSLDIEEVAFE